MYVEVEGEGQGWTRNKQAACKLFQMASALCTIVYLMGYKLKAQGSQDSQTVAVPLAEQVLLPAQAPQEI
jgi:hypothetical protein